MTDLERVIAYTNSSIMTKPATIIDANNLSQRLPIHHRFEVLVADMKVAAYLPVMGIVVQRRVEKDSRTTSKRIGSSITP